MAASDSYVTTAKGRLDKQGGDPDTGYISKADVQTAMDDLQDGWQADDTGKLDVAGGTMTGALTLSGAPSSTLHAATKDYVDTAAAAAVPLAGGTMTGALTLSGAPTSNLHAATKLYVDNAVGGGAGLYYNVLDYGATGDGTTDDKTAIQNAINAADDAGGIVFLPPGNYALSSGLTMSSYTHIQGSEPASRYWGYSTSQPPSACKLTVKSGFTGSAVFTIPAGTTAYSFSDFTVSGANIGSVHGFLASYSASGGSEDNGVWRNVAVIGMGGSGITGDLWAARMDSIFVGGCNGWGLLAGDAGTGKWADVHVHNSYIAGNVLGGLSLAGSSNSGLNSFVACRFERSGYKSVSPYYVDADSPGIYLRRCNDTKFVACETDANTGNGVDIATVSSGSDIYNIHFTTCDFRRDGFGDGGSADEGQFSGIKILGGSGRDANHISFIDCTVSTGKADDGGSFPSYYHPYYSVNINYAAYTKIIGGRYSDGNTPVPFSLGANCYKPHISLHYGHANQYAHVIPSGSTPTAGLVSVVGQQWFHTGTNKPCWYDGSNWRYADGTTI